MTELDDLLGQLTIDVPEAPTVDELRSRAGNRHRRPMPMVAAVIGLVVISAVLVQLLTNEPTHEDRPDERTFEPPSLTTGPRSFEISVGVPGNPLIRASQFDLARWDWISEDLPSLGIRVNVTSRALLPIRLTPPTWERVTEDGVRYLGNAACNDDDVCVVDVESVTLLPGATSTFWVYVQPRLTALGDYSFITQFEYEVLLTGERGWIPVNVALRIWEPEPGTEPVSPPTTVIVELPPASTTTVPPASTTTTTTTTTPPTTQ